jgi:hypothetical protein
MKKEIILSGISDGSGASSENFRWQGDVAPGLFMVTLYFKVTTLSTDITKTKSLGTRLLYRPLTIYSELRSTVLKLQNYELDKFHVDAPVTALEIR